MRSVASGSDPRTGNDVQVHAAETATGIFTLADVSMPRSTTEYIDESVSTHDTCGINVVELGSPEQREGPTTGAASFAQMAHSTRSTFPGSTTFKALCNSYLRKLLRGQAPEALYWVANATLANWERAFARLRLTVVVEDLRIEKSPEETHTSATIKFEFGAPNQAKI